MLNHISKKSSYNRYISIFNSNNNKSNNSNSNLFNITTSSISSISSNSSNLNNNNNFINNNKPIHFNQSKHFLLSNIYNKRNYSNNPTSSSDIKNELNSTTKNNNSSGNISSVAPAPLLVHCLVYHPSSKIYVQESVHKLSFTNKYGLLLRDLRLESSFSKNGASVLVRPGAVLFKLENVSILISSSALYLLSIDDKSVEFMNSLTSKISKDENGSSFEMCAFEAVLDSFCSSISNRVYTLRKQTKDFVKSGFTLGDARILLLRNEMGNLVQLLSEFERSLQDVLNSDEDLAGMYLSSTRTKAEHYEVEILMENYLREVLRLKSEVLRFKDSIDAAENSLHKELATARNEMMKLELRMSMITASLASGAFVGTMFGMNLPHHLEGAYAFYCVLGFSSLTSGLVYWNSFRRAVKKGIINKYELFF